MSIEPLYVIGAGGHGKVVLDVLACTARRPVVLCDDDQRRTGQVVLGHRVMSRDTVTIKAGNAFHPAIGDGSIRQSVSASLLKAGAVLTSVVHPQAAISAYSSIGNGSFIAAQAVISSDARLGAGVIVNHGAIVDHDCIVGDFAHVAPNATLGGGAEIGTLALIGAGATVLPGVRVGAGAIIAAGATIVQNVAPGETVIFALTRKTKGLCS